MLSLNRYLNYFGKVENVEKILVRPILFIKGKTKVALYGIGHIYGSALNRALFEKRIKFARPTQDTDEWFNILVLHQNKYKGMALGTSKSESISESDLPGIFDLVIWGHEHESMPHVYEVTGQDSVTMRHLQPGSTVATTLNEAESKQKHCFVLRICKKMSEIEPIPLLTVRPFIYRTILLASSGKRADMHKELV